MKKYLDKIDHALGFAYSDRFDPEIYAEVGFFVMRNAIDLNIVDEWRSEWDKFCSEQLIGGREVNQANPVALTEALPSKLASMYKHPVFFNTIKPLFGENIALYNHRFVIKDKYSSGKVFLHQDCCYHLGNLNKCSLFVPLGTVNEENGGLSFYAGSHKLGYLGDAGEINPESFDVRWRKVTPALQPGDFVIMNSATWHESGPNHNGIDRILADMIMQPADDPTGKELLCGEWQTDIFYSPLNCVQYFNNSRVRKIIKYETELGMRKVVVD